MAPGWRSSRWPRGRLIFRPLCGDFRASRFLQDWADRTHQPFRLMVRVGKPAAIDPPIWPPISIHCARSHCQGMDGVPPRCSPAQA